MDMHKLNSLHNTGWCCLDKVAAFNNFKNGRTKAADKLVERQFDDSVASDRNTEERGKIKKRTKIDAVRQFGLPLLQEWHEAIINHILNTDKRLAAFLVASEQYCG
ncbi:MAG: hypothetical protein Q8L15_19255 [Methylobacter sp.]|nr:hypothetical protein [Methylobacter sp.]